MPKIDLEKCKTTEARLRTIRERLWCPCGGEIVATGDGFSDTFGATWSHKCEECGGTCEVPGTRYPRVVHK